MLPLYGVATYVRGLERIGSRPVVRIRAPGSVCVHPDDVALVRSSEEIEVAVAGRFNGAIAITDSDPNAMPAANVLPNLIVLPVRFNYLADGDILGISPDSRRFRTLYRRASQHNSFLVTERCNHYCLMCSQPPRDVDDSWLLDEIRRCLPLVDRATQSIGFTGGEPLLEWRQLVSLLADCRDQLPHTAVHVLSNGRAFANTEVVAAWAGIGHPNLTLGIPIYSVIDHVHDYVVQARGAFNETVIGILKLKDQRQRVEVRVVLHAITAPRIVETCGWLARNLPFVDHIALMGLENTGFAIANDEMLWIDPVDYRGLLAEAVGLLVAARVKVSVYNLPRCVLDRSIWPFAVQSISDWKNGYLEECDRCVEKVRCSGFFTSGRPRRSRGISPIWHSDR